MAVHGWSTLQSHFDANPGQRTAFGETKIRKIGLEKFQFLGISGPEGQRQGHGMLVLAFQLEDLAVLAGPKLVGLHGEIQNVLNPL